VPTRRNDGQSPESKRSQAGAWERDNETPGTEARATEEYGEAQSTSWDGRPCPSFQWSGRPCPPSPRRNAMTGSHN
jgi:hypothetical protein